MTLTEIQALAAEGGFPLAFTHRHLEHDMAFVLYGPEEVALHGAIGDASIPVHDLADIFSGSDLWYPLGGFR